MHNHDTIRIRAYYPNYFTDSLIAYVALRITEHFNTPRVRADLMGICSDVTLNKYKARRPITQTEGKRPPVTRRVYRDAIPRGFVWKLCTLLLSERRVRAIADWRFLSSLRRGDIVYLWPSISVSLYRKVKKQGHLIVTERINTLERSSKALLDQEFRSLSLPVTHGLSEKSIEEELDCMHLSDLIFSPSPAVTDSLVCAGISRDKILSSSYGLEQHECVEEVVVPACADGKPVAIFVGSICVRKGIHLLLKAWERANVDGRLVVVGRIAPEIEDLFRSFLARNRSVEHVDFVKDLSPIYRSADVFILPSVEEGSPLVTYLALGAGLPSVVSPMGAGGAVRDGTDGFVVDPHDEASFAEAIKKLFSDGPLRARMSSAARSAARSYTWDLVAARRLEALTTALGADSV